MPKSPPWTDTENAAIVALYFAMLDMATAGQPYNKAAMLREANQPQTQPAGFKATPYSAELRARSKGSIEAKLMNCTAAHRTLIDSRGSERYGITMAGFGYVPLGNYQASLKIAIHDALLQRDRGNEQHRVA